MPLENNQHVRIVRDYHPRKVRPSKILGGFLIVLVLGIFLYAKLSPTGQVILGDENFTNVTHEITLTINTSLAKLSNFSQHSTNNGTNVTVQNTTSSKKLPTHIPVKLSSQDILISFRLDDITFEKKQEESLKNALSLAKKYNLTFDLGVIAQPFDEKADPVTYLLYEEHQDVFEIVAHGYTHSNPLDGKHTGEFFDVTTKKSINSSIQEEHIKQMAAIFKKNNLQQAGKIFVVPWLAADSSTILLGKKYGYTKIIKSSVPDLSMEELVPDVKISRDYLAIPMKESLSIKEIDQWVNKVIELADNQKRIQIILHPLNLEKIENSETFIYEMVKLAQRKNKYPIKIGMLSDG